MLQRRPAPAAAELGWGASSAPRRLTRWWQSRFDRSRTAPRGGNRRGPICQNSKIMLSICCAAAVPERSRMSRASYHLEITSYPLPNPATRHQSANIIISNCSPVRLLTSMQHNISSSEIPKMTLALPCHDVGTEVSDNHSVAVELPRTSFRGTRCSTKFSEKS